MARIRKKHASTGRIKIKQKAMVKKKSESPQSPQLQPAPVKVPSNAAVFKVRIKKKNGK